MQMESREVFQWLTVNIFIPPTFMLHSKDETSEST